MLYEDIDRQQTIPLREKIFVLFVYNCYTLACLLEQNTVIAGIKYSITRTVSCIYHGYSTYLEDDWQVLPQRFKKKINASALR